MERKFPSTSWRLKDFEETGDFRKFNTQNVAAPLPVLQKWRTLAWKGIMDIQRANKFLLNTNFLKNTVILKMHLRPWFTFIQLLPDPVILFLKKGKENNS